LYTEIIDFVCYKNSIEANKR